MSIKNILQDKKSGNSFVFTRKCCDEWSPVRTDNQKRKWSAGGTGLIKVLPDGRFRGFPYPVAAGKETFEFVHAIIIDKANIIWIGTAKGLIKFDHVTEKFIHYHHQQGDPASLNFDVIYELYNVP